MKLELANNDDVTLAEHGHISPESVRRFECEGVVDSGAAHLVLPQQAMDALGLPESWRARTRYADGSTGERTVIKDVSLRLCDRESVFSAVVEPNRKDALIGAIVMGELDLMIDCVGGKLTPRDPDLMISELEGMS